MQGQRYRACRAGTGKAPGAVALLRQVTDGSLWALSPTVTLNELAEREFVRGLGYVVINWQHDQSAGDITDFTWRTLRDQFADAGAHLVITTMSERTRRTAESVRHFAWERPPVRDLLATYLAGTGAAGWIDEVIDQLPGDCGLRPTVALARRLATGEDPATALKELSNDAAEQVQQWFTASRPLAETLEVIALVFASGRSERAFESMLALLTETIEEAGYALDGETGGSKRKKDTLRPLLPIRAERSRAESLIARETIVIEGAARSMVHFRLDGHRHHVLAEGWRNYDGAFWDTIRGWLNSVIARSATEDDAETQLKVAKDWPLWPRWT